ncbi:hypothetical protein ACWDR0_09170 [Streptomyces sp. NPDC003691]
MEWADEGVRIAVWWLVGFAAFHVLIGIWCLLRGLRDRVVILRVRFGAIGPVEASRQADGDAEAARTGVLLLIKAGAVEVSDTGVLSVVPRAAEPADPVLSALLGGIRRRGAGGTPLYRIREKTGFEDFWSLLTRRAPDVRQHAEPSRAAAQFAAAAASFGMISHGMATDVPFPPFDGDPGLWMVLWWPLWGLLALTSLVWPKDHSRRWRRFNAYCRRRAAAELEGLPGEARRAVGKSATRPVPPRPARRPAPRSGNRTSPDGGGGWADEAADSCGGCGCGSD